MVTPVDSSIGEDSALLGTRRSSLDDSHIQPSPAPTVHSQSRSKQPWLRVVALLVLVAVISDIGESLWTAPRVRLFEAALCKSYYQDHEPSVIDGDRNVPEHLCKLDNIQDALASILGLQFFFDSIPAIVLPIPFGRLADQRGRKKILMLALAGFTLSYIWTLLVIGVFHLPLQWVWLSSAFFIIGGGPTVGTTLLTTMVADVSPSEVRSTVFFYRFCTDLVAELTIPPLTSYLMARDIWIPLLGAVLFQGGSSLLVAVVPETAPWPGPKESTDQPETRSEGHKVDWSIRKRVRSFVHQAHSSFLFVTKDRVVAALVVTFLISKLGRQSTNVLFQYVSKRYGWTLAQAGLLISLRAAVNITLFIVMLPLVAAVILQRVKSAAVRDLLLTRGSIILLLLGSAVLFASATQALMIIGVVIFTLGSGFAPAARSLVTSRIENIGTAGMSDVARLYALIAVMEGVGSLLAAVGMSWALRLGLRMGHQWYGLPFGFAAILFALVAMIVFLVKSKDLRS